MTTLGNILRQYAPLYKARFSPPPLHLKVIDAITQCRTAALGGHAWACTSCGAVQVHYNSCGNRHCPNCQAFEKEKWVDARKKELLPVPYLHVVFTIPHQLNSLILSNDRLMYNLLFKASWQTIRQLAADPQWLGAQTGMIGVLHTWGSNMSLHPHLHCIIPAGGLEESQTKWIATKNKGFFAPNKKVIAPIFRAIFLKKLRQAFEQDALQYFGSAKPLEDSKELTKLFLQLKKINWNVYAKRPFGGPEQILNYLSRYTHRIAISNQRIVSVENGRVTFLVKNYKKKAKNGLPPVQPLTLEVLEFIRRFLMHVLPKGFQRIRYFGILATRNRKTKLIAVQQLLKYQPPCINPLNWKQRLTQLTGIDPDACPHCQQKTLVFLGNISQQSTFSGRSPPLKIQIITPEGDCIPLSNR